MPCVRLLGALLVAIVSAVGLDVSPALEGSASSARPGHFVVPLHRQRVPVRSDAYTISYKSVYFGTISLGSPVQQHFSVVFDTGSGHMIVPSAACASETCRIHRRYDQKASEYAVDVDYDGTRVLPGAPRDQITVAFGTGEVTGQFVHDRLCLSDPASDQGGGSTNGSGLEGASQMAEDGCMDLRVVMATEMTHEPFHAFAFDGVLGLGLDGLALAPEFSFFGQMVAQGKVQEPMFGVFLADSDREVSELCFGGHQAERVRGGLTWVPVASPGLGYWQISIRAVRVGNRTLGFCADGACRAVVDTGTSLLAVPSAFSEQLRRELEGPLRDPAGPAGPEEEEVDCSGAEGALLHFEIEGSKGGATLTLEPGDYSRPAIRLVDEEAAAQGEPGDDGAGDGGPGRPAARCRPTLMALDLPEPLGPKLFIMGEPVLRKYYTAYDWQEKRVGFGLAVHAPAPERPTLRRRRPLLL